ncbi:MAG TPA: FHA domain-containing protein [Kofleriaceae bacterium]|nr:FHA domain-containing protein [Kofleriaceae bacterium]
MNTLFSVVARCEHKNVEPATAAAPASRLWAAIKVEPTGGGLERERAPLAVALVVDVSGSMHGEPLAHVIKSCGLLAELLGERDRLAIVTFASHAGVRCGLTQVDAAGRAQIARAVASMTAEGETNLYGGIEVAAGVLMTAPAGLRRVIVVMSDGRPNVGPSAPAELARFVTGLKLAVSSLGFGLSHDENVLGEIATAGSGRYAYIPDPVLARVELARAALAHSGIVADQLELKIEPADGVELLQILPASPLRVGGHGVTTPIGDVFVDEGRAVAIELGLALGPMATGRLAAVSVSGRAPDGQLLRTTASLDVDVRTGPRLVDRDAQRDVVIVQADAGRGQARAQADRGALPAAAAILRQLAARIDALAGFVRNDGSLLAELREQIEDEAAGYERRSTNQERVHQRKASLVFTVASPGYARTPAGVAAPPTPACLHGVSGPVAGRVFPLRPETQIGRGARNDIVVGSGMLSRSHTRIVWLGDHWMLQDLGTTNGSFVNGKQVQSCRLDDGDYIALGDAVFLFKRIG